MKLSRALIFPVLLVHLTGCPASKTQSSSRSAEGEQAAGSNAVVSSAQTSANAESPAAGKGRQESNQQKTKKEIPKTVETKTLGGVAVHSDKITVPETVTKRENLSVAIEPAVKSDVPTDVSTPAVPTSAVPPETLPLTEVSAAELAPDTGYVMVVVEAAPSGEQTVVEEKVFVTLA